MNAHIILIIFVCILHLCYLQFYHFSYSHRPIETLRIEPLLAKIKCNSMYKSFQHTPWLHLLSSSNYQLAVRADLWDWNLNLLMNGYILENPPRIKIKMMLAEQKNIANKRVNIFIAEFYFFKSQRSRSWMNYKSLIRKWIWYFKM